MADDTTNDLPQDLLVHLLSQLDTQQRAELSVAVQRARAKVWDGIAAGLSMRIVNPPQPTIGRGGIITTQPPFSPERVQQRVEEALEYAVSAAAPYTRIEAALRFIEKPPKEK